MAPGGSGGSGLGGGTGLGGGFGPGGGPGGFGMLTGLPPSSSARERVRALTVPAESGYNNESARCARHTSSRRTNDAGHLGR